MEPTSTEIWTGVIAAIATILGLIIGSLRGKAKGRDEGYLKAKREAQERDSTRAREIKEKANEARTKSADNPASGLDRLRDRGVIRDDD